MIAWPAADARHVLRFWRDWVVGTPDELCTMGAFLYAPPAPFVPIEVQGTPIVAIACFHLDPDGSAEADLRALREFGPPPADALPGDSGNVRRRRAARLAQLLALGLRRSAHRRRDRRVAFAHRRAPRAAGPGAHPPTRWGDEPRP